MLGNKFCHLIISLAANINCQALAKSIHNPAAFRAASALPRKRSCCLYYHAWVGLTPWRPAQQKRHLALCRQADHRPIE